MQFSKNRQVLNSQLSLCVPFLEMVSLGFFVVVVTYCYCIVLINKASFFPPQIWNHPDVLYEALQKENQANEQDLDLDDITSASNPRCPAAGPGLKAKVADSSNSKVNNTLPPPLNPSQDRSNQVITYEWVCHNDSPREAAFSAAYFNS